MAQPDPELQKLRTEARMQLNELSDAEEWDELSEVTKPDIQPPPTYAKVTERVLVPVLNTLPPWQRGIVVLAIVAALAWGGAELYQAGHALHWW